MNEPIEFAQKSIGQKTTAKQLLEVIKRGRSHTFINGRATYNRASYSNSFSFELTAKQDRTNKRAEVCTTIEVPGYVGNGSTSLRKEHISTIDGSKWVDYSHDEAYRPTRGYWSLSYCETLVNVLELLPSNAEVAFSIHLDAGTNELLVRADASLPWGNEKGLHSDSLYLIASWMHRGKPVEKQFLLATSVGAHNSARFGSPRNDRDTTGYPGY